MILQFLGELYDFLLKGFFVLVIGVIVLYGIRDTIDNLKEKIKRKKDRN